MGVGIALWKKDSHGCKSKNSMRYKIRQFVRFIV